MINRVLKRAYSSNIKNDIRDLHEKVHKLTCAVNEINNTIKKHKLEISSFYMELDYQDEKMTKGFINMGDEMFKMTKFLENEIMTEVDILNDKIHDLK